MSVGVLCALRGPAEGAAVRALTASPDLEVVRRCADLAELLACAAAGLGRVAVVSADLPMLDLEALRHLRGSGVLVLAVDDGTHPVARACDAVVARGEDVPGAVDRLLAEPRTVSPLGAAADLPGSRTDPAGVDLASSGSFGADGSVGAASPTGTPSAPGRVVTVWGPTGAPGRTTIAVNLAAELASLDGRPGVDDILLVDADTYGGTVAPALGLLDEAPGVAAAVRAATAGRLDPPALAACARSIPGGVRVLTGLARPERWPELTPAGLEELWDCCRRTAAWTVVDSGFSLEQDETLSYDTRAPRRNAATSSALAAADLVVVVGGGDPVGLQRLVRGLGDLDDVGVPSSARVVVVNRVRASASGPRPGEAVAQALLRYAGVRDVRLVPQDGPACDGALLAARTLAEHAPSSPVRRAVAALAREVLAAVPAHAAH